MTAPRTATGAAARALLAAVVLSLSLLAPAAARAQDACSLEAGGFRAVVPAAAAAQFRLQGAPGGGRVTIAGISGICYLYLRRPDATAPEPLAPLHDDVVSAVQRQIRRAEIFGVDIAYAMPVPEVSRGGLEVRLGWTQLHGEGRQYVAETLLDPDTGAHVFGLCALQDLRDAPPAEAFLRSVHLDPSPDLPQDCRP